MTITPPSYKTETQPFINAQENPDRGEKKKVTKKRQRVSFVQESTIEPGTTTHTDLNRQGLEKGEEIDRRLALEQTGE